jgi:purine-binding chemotaxis protein CheW
LFACGSGTYGVPSELASEVVNLPTLTRVPGSPPHVLGVFAHRGEVLPVIDLVHLAGGGADTEWTRAVVVRAPAGVVALAATQVWGVAPLEGANEPLGPSGVQQHLRGPMKASAVRVGSAALEAISAIETDGLLAFLAQGG